MSTALTVNWYMETTDRMMEELAKESATSLALSECKDNRRLAKTIVKDAVEFSGYDMKNVVVDFDAENGLFAISLKANEA